jgi:hypothetical protein
MVGRTQQVVDAYAAGDEDRLAVVLKRWAKELVRLADPALRQHFASRLEACDPA